MFIKKLSSAGILIAISIVLCLTVMTASSPAAIDGLSGTIFNFTAEEHYINTPDGGVIYMWGYANQGSLPQYPGPTLIVTEGADITINLTNNLAYPTSIIFPGHNVTATGGTPGLLTSEALPSGGTVTYSFRAEQPGTYTYYSGTRPDLQIEMGLFGAIIVRPLLGNSYAYNHPATGFDREYLEILSDLDLNIHEMAESGLIDQIDTATFSPVYWFINGRAFPDTIDMPNAPWLPTQPYSSLVLMSVGEKVLVRIIGAGRDIHPQHYHGNNGLVIARDGRLLQSTAGAGPDLAEDINTVNSAPGQTVDFIWDWTGKDMGWDFYGHSITEDTVPFEIHDSTTLEHGIDDSDLTLEVSGWNNSDVPATHKVNAIVWDSISHASYTAAVASGDFEMITMNKVTGSPNEYIIERAMNGTFAETWSPGVTIDYTDHGKPLPVILPELQNLTFGAAYSGSPYLGQTGSLPPGEAGLNEIGAFPFPWHSHHEKEIVNNGVFIGGMVTLVFVLHP